MAENEQATAADESLDQAAAEAVLAAENAEQSQSIDQEEETVAEPDGEEQLPKDHNERSQLGRKLSAYHRRMDEIDNRVDRGFERLESMLQSFTSKSDPDDAYAEEQPMTRREMDEYLASRENQKEKAAANYKKVYDQTMLSFGFDMPDEEFDAIVAELNFNYNPSNDPKRDAQDNFRRAENLYLRKQMSANKKDINLKKERAPGSGVVNQKTEQKQTPVPELDGAARNYYEFMVSRDGEEAARKKVKGLNG